MSGNYSKWRKHYKNNEGLPIEELKKIQESKFIDLLRYTFNNSPFYAQFYKDVDVLSISEISEIQKLPIIHKEILRANIDQIITLPKNRAKASKTGGTTGKSLTVYKFENDIQERIAILDNFRAKEGYELGKRTAWFSGKSLLTKRDIKKNRFWKTDYWYNVRYYSTFHMKDTFLKYYIENLTTYSPEFLVGFPSTIYEIAKYGLAHNIDFPSNTVKAIFPTAETVTKETRAALELFFKTKVYDQYASSEGAPFIFECKLGNLHMDIQTGVFEVLDENDTPAKEGRLILTSFTSYGTPLIRYDIGDSLLLSDKICTCGNNNPLVEEILGRVSDYIYSSETGKINLGNVSNTLKDTKGIIKFQVIQDSLERIEIKIVLDSAKYSNHIEKIFLDNWRDRVGTKMDIDITQVDDIAVEKSGKYRIVQNNIKHLIENNS
ncbi:phenylacetate--CoA ligase family protein [Patiriisocius marinistellae]|nr:phenylacetate--CoA ligase family protein [Patiriisocius marinistellae]